MLAADVAGYSRLMGGDEAGTLARLKAHRRELIEPAVAAGGGRVVKLMGDGMLVEFASVLDAVECALAIQRGMAARNAALPEAERILFRIGINLGDVLADGDDIYGDGVNVAARLEALAAPGGICVSGKVHDEVQGRVPIQFRDLGRCKLKNIARSVQVYAASGDGLVAPAAAASQAADGGRSSPGPSIVVLAFANMSGDPKQDYFGDGIAEDIITDLAKLSGLFVIARNSAFAYKGRAPDLRQVAAELGVRYVLEGSVRKAGRRVRVTAQLVDGTTGGHVWAERWDRELTDIFAVQDDLTREIVAALKVRLTADESDRLGRHGTRDLAAYDLFLRARELAWRHERQAAAEARALLERVIERDPGFAAAYAWLGQLHAQAYSNAYDDDGDAALVTGHRLAEQAVAIDPAEPAGHFVLGITHMWLRRHEAALAAAERAIALSPGATEGYAAKGTTLLYAGRPAEAIPVLEEAMRLDPHFPDLYLHFLALAQFGLDRFEEAARTLSRRLARNPAAETSHVLLASCHGHLGRIEEARREWAEALRINPGYSFEQRRKVLPYRDPADLERLAEGLRRAGLTA